MNKQQAFEMVHIHGSFIQHVGEEHKKDPDIVKAALEHSTSLGDVVIYVPREVLLNDIVTREIIRVLSKESQETTRDLGLLLGELGDKSKMFRRFLITEGTKAEALKYFRE